MGVYELVHMLIVGEKVEVSFSCRESSQAGRSRKSGGLLRIFAFFRSAWPVRSFGGSKIVKDSRFDVLALELWRQLRVADQFSLFRVLQSIEYVSPSLSITSQTASIENSS